MRTETEESMSSKAMRLVDQMTRDCREWMKTGEAIAVSDSEEELTAAIVAYEAGWLKGLGRS